MKYLIILALLSAGCAVPHVTMKCRHLSIGQEVALVEQYGVENVERWITSRDGEEATHMQCRVRIDGEWHWVPSSEWVTVYVQDKPDFGFTPIRKSSYGIDEAIVNYDNRKGE